MLATTQWPLERASNLTSLVWVCVLWLPESLMGLSALWSVRTHNGKDRTTMNDKINDVTITILCMKRMEFRRIVSLFVLCIRSACILRLLYVMSKAKQIHQNFMMLYSLAFCMVISMTGKCCNLPCHMPINCLRQETGSWFVVRHYWLSLGNFATPYDLSLWCTFLQDSKAKCMTIRN